MELWCFLLETGKKKPQEAPKIKKEPCDQNLCRSKNNEKNKNQKNPAY